MLALSAGSSQAFVYGLVPASHSKSGQGEGRLVWSGTDAASPPCSTLSAMSPTRGVWNQPGATLGSRRCVPGDLRPSDSCDPAVLGRFGIDPAMASMLMSNLSAASKGA